MLKKAGSLKSSLLFFVPGLDRVVFHKRQEITQINEAVLGRAGPKKYGIEQGWLMVVSSLCIALSGVVGG